MNPPELRLTKTGIQALLAQFQAEAIAQPSANSTENTAAHQFQKLMEIYCVVKAGGLKVQIEAARAFLNRETAKTEAEIAQLQMQEDPDNQAVQSLHEEIAELHRSVSWRLAILQSIHPDEEAAVNNCLAEIEQWMAQGNATGV